MSELKVNLNDEINWETITDHLKDIGNENFFAHFRSTDLCNNEYGKNFWPNCLVSALFRLLSTAILKKLSLWSHHLIYVNSRVRPKQHYTFVLPICVAEIILRNSHSI